MIGVKWGVHREPTEQAVVRVDDPKHPLTAALRRQGILATRMSSSGFRIGPYSRDKLHVLLSMDVEKTDMNQGRPCAKPCVRDDQDYAVSWVRSYGKGRVFFCISGTRSDSVYDSRACAAFSCGNPVYPRRSRRGHHPRAPDRPPRGVNQKDMPPTRDPDSAGGVASDGGRHGGATRSNRGLSVRGRPRSRGATGRNGGEVVRSSD